MSGMGTRANEEGLTALADQRAGGRSKSPVAQGGSIAV